MIYFLKGPNSDKVAIAYCHDRRLFESSSTWLSKGTTVLRIIRGSQNDVYSQRDRFRESIDIMGWAFHLTGALRRYLELPEKVSVKALSKVYLITEQETRAAMKSVGVKKIAREDATRIYDEHRKIKLAESAPSS